jgi:transposase
MRRRAFRASLARMSEPKSMRKIREILRLRFACGQEIRAIALSVGGSPSTVHGYLSRAAAAKLENWETVEPLSDEELRALLLPGVRQRPGPRGVERATIDCRYLHVELRRVGVTLLQLWREYCETNAARSEERKPYSYSQFCDRYALFRKSLKLSMRQTHVAGERAFVDYSGKKPSLVDPSTGEVREVELFVMTLGASHYTYVEASLSQTLPDFCSSLIRGFEFFGGTPQVIVPDQLRSAVRHPDRYDPDINRTLHELSEHYGITVLPARPRKPKDKAKVETAVLIVQRWILARLRNETFHTLAELNGRIAELCKILNDTPFQKIDGTRRSLFEKLDRPALRALPQRFDLGLWKRARVNVDYHVALFDRLYSVPWVHIGSRVDVRFTQSLVEIYLDRDRIASHPRSYASRGFATTDPEHMPPSHREMGRWTQERLLGWAETHGASVRNAIAKLLDSYPRPELGYRAALGVVRLADKHGSDALNQACSRALAISSLPPRRRLLLALLRPDALHVAPRNPASSRTLGTHEHIRGPDYFEFNSDLSTRKDTVH